MVRVLLLIASSVLPRLCSRRRLSVPNPLSFRFSLMVTHSPFLSSFLLKKEKTEPPLSSLTACTEEKIYLPWGLEFNWINVAQARFGETSVSSLFSTWVEDKLLDLGAGTGSSGIQTPATASGLCMGQHVSESSLLFSFSSPLQLVLQSRYKQNLTKFRGRQRFLVHSKRRWGPPGTQTSQDLGLEKLKYGKDYDHFTAATISLLTLLKKKRL